MTDEPLADEPLADEPLADQPLARAHEHARAWLASLDDRDVPPRASAAEVADALGRDLPDGPSDPTAVVDLLAAAGEPGLTAIPSGRFFGFVMGGTHPAAMAADWLTSAWDQNAGLRTVTPTAMAAGGRRRGWVLDLLGLPAESEVGFVTGGTMANFTCLAAGRDEVLRRAGWDVASRGLVGSPGVRVLVGEERHDSVDLVLRYLGLGAPGSRSPPTSRAGSPRRRSRTRWPPTTPAPTLVVLQAGNVHSGAFDPLAETIEVAHAHGAWVHVDGAFGLFAACLAHPPPPGGRRRGRRLVGDRRPQDPQRPLRLRPRDRPRPARRCGRRCRCTRRTSSTTRRVTRSTRCPR